MPLELLRKYFSDPMACAMVLEHSQLVAAKALLLAQTVHTTTTLDLKFIEEAALLHDIGVCQTYAPGLGCHGSAPYICHGIIGRDILEREGLARHAMVCERHIGVGLTAADITHQALPLPVRDMSPVSVEEKLICLADLFYSKKPRLVGEEKTITRIRQELSTFGEAKVTIFDGWLSEFHLLQPST